jgi:hypothetical protein
VFEDAGGDSNELAGGGIAGGMIAVVYGVIELLKHRRTKRRDTAAAYKLSTIRSRRSPRTPGHKQS